MSANVIIFCVFNEIKASIKDFTHLNGKEEEQNSESYQGPETQEINGVTSGGNTQQRSN